jgi:hypothetical protein
VEHQRDLSRRQLIEAARREATRKEHEAQRDEIRRIRDHQDKQREEAVDRSKKQVDEAH